MASTLEGRRIARGLHPDEAPGGALVRFSAVAPGDAAGVERRCKDVMMVVLHFIPFPPRFPDLKEWREALPGWFVGACAPDRGPEPEPGAWRQEISPERLRAAGVAGQPAWTLSEWLIWFDPFNGAQRSWRWWASGVVDDDHLWIEVDVLQETAGLDALDWLLRAAGATEIDRGWSAHPTTAE